MASRDRFLRRDGTQSARCCDVRDAPGSGEPEGASARVRTHDSVGRGRGRALSRPRSVLFDARLVLERPTGIGRYIVSLLPALCAAAPQWTFHVLRRAAPWPGYAFAEWHAANATHHISTQRHMSLGQHLTLPRLAQELGVDVMHYPHLDAPVLWGRVPVVATIHDAKELTLRHLFGRFDGMKRWYLRRCFEATVRRSAAVIAVSRATSSDLQRAFGNLARVRV